MKIIALLSLLISFSTASFAQKQTYDLVTFTPPKGWTKEEKQNVIVYTKVDNKNKTWCQIGVYKSTASKGNIEDDLQSEWNEMAVKQFSITDSMQATETQEADGWKIKTGSGKFTFNNQPAAVLLTTFSGYDRCTSIIATTNSQAYLETIENFVGSIDVKKPEISRPQPNVGNVPVIGPWGKSNTVSQVNNRFGNYSYNKQQYTFNSDGSYGFAAKTYDEKSSETYLIIERGSFVISGNAITLTPKTSVIEAWSKKNGADNWNQLKSTQKRSLEIVTYQFSIADNNLLLQTVKQTERDGKFNNGNTYSYGPPGTFTPITLPEGDQITAEEIQKEPLKQITTQTNSSVTNTGFAFSITNFDDGWTSTVQEDWVEAAKGNIRVLIHYPNKQADTYNSVLLDGLKNAWNILVAPKYSSGSNFEFKPVSGWQSIEFAEADLVEMQTGKTVHVVLFKMNYSNGNGKYLEFITPDKRSFEAEFGAYHETSYGWEKMEKMANYNKFAVAASDLHGKWTNDFSGAIQYVNAYTGYDAGMATHASVENFQIGSGNTYHWDLGVASGQVGNIKFQSVKSNGEFTMNGNWQITFSDMEGKPRTYNAYFSCIKGLRILWLDDRAFAKVQ